MIDRNTESLTGRCLDAETLRMLIECKQNIVVAGGTGSGKTSRLNALSALIPEGERC